ncbi:trifunctional serine/threonine-protein kinase/ATP-binding protein/sensor histidine kinase [Oscillatoria acuminata]|uniref:histidine kinase n=1 Tax=Oscillatoria acuminata PCC 6304 TaxID=56110 RepID=K9TKG7_9CYAN|nr:ATP-binding sensor histidine kinase [Oscillatoria acuminata]AFY82888.1 putative ATPase [Oscillatoria acuminata PCC 6304]
MDIFPTLPGYQVTEELYIGTRTLVYRGIQTDTNQPVVIKILRNEYPNFSEIVQFRNQYTIAKSLNFTGITKALGLEPYQNCYALIIEDFGGISLSTYLEKATKGREQSKHLSLSEFLHIALQITESLHYLHQNHVIHKDIKPANILINPDSKQVKLIDFSISCLLPRETQEIQNAQALEGTLAYLSPEQTGRMNRGIDYRCDFYSLGITFYEILTKDLPFISEDGMELIHFHLAKTAIPLHQVNPEIPLVLSKIVSKLMAKNAEERYQTALGINHDLQKCLTQLQENGQIEDFELAQQDISDRFLIPEKLYGRETEVEELLVAFERVSQGSTEMMLVAGFSGIGKTAVINEVHKPIARQRGYFIKGKYDQFKQNIPLGAFVQAFQDLMEQLLSESDAQLQTWKAQIIEAVGENGQILIDVIPALEEIIGKQPALAELSGISSQNRFNLIFHKFLQVFTRKEHPLVIFLDDLQWADSASLELLKLLMQETEYLLVLGAYRDNEVSPLHPFILAVDEKIKAGAIVNTITLSPLSQPDLNRLIAETLNCGLSLAQSLTTLVYQKTKGNPFFAIQFLKALYEEQLISFNWTIQHWQCDIAQVEALAITDDVVDFMALQLLKLPPETQDILKLAACVGAEFDLKTLAIISKQSPEMTAAALWQSLQKGLVIPTSKIYKFFAEAESDEGDKLLNSSLNPTYCFVHDRVQQAAYSLIPDDQKQKVHYKIGQLLLEEISPEDREERIFELVNQLNYGTSLGLQQPERNNLAKLNLIAGRKARASTAYQAAREYVNLGLQLLGIEAWDKEYETTLSLHEIAAEVASLLGDFEQMNQWMERVIQSVKTPVDGVQVYYVKIQALAGQNQLLEAIATGLSVLKLLGVNLPEDPTPVQMQQAIQELNILLEQNVIEDLGNLPPMQDPLNLAIMKVASSICPSCTMTGSIPLLVLLTVLQIKLSIEFGNSCISAISYVNYGIILNNVLQDVETAGRFGRLAYQLASQPEYKNVLSSVNSAFTLFIYHRTAHLQETIAIAQQGYQAGLEVGDLQYGGYNKNIACFHAYWTGQPLAELEPQISLAYQQLLEINQAGTINFLSIYWEVVLTLMGNPEGKNIRLLDPDYQTKLLSECLATKDYFQLSLFYFQRFILRFWLGDLPGAVEDAKQARQFLMPSIGTIGEAIFYFYDSVVLLATHESGSTELDIKLQQVQENQAQLQKWANYAPMNHLHKYHLVEAECYRLKGQKLEALESYDLAITLAKTHQYLQDEALANELAAKFYLAWGKEKFAAGYMQEAYYSYAKWGAKIKIIELEERYPQLLRPILKQPRTTPLFPPKRSSAVNFSNARETISSTHTSSNISEALDLATLLKVYQAISGEIELDKLLTTLMEIVIANAGADKCVLVLKPDLNELKVVALVEDGNPPQLLPSIPLESSPDVAISVVNTVKHTLKPLVLEDALMHTRFMTDSYLQKHQPKSVLCSPILHQGQCIGLLYLENHLTIGAFTSDRVEVLNLICAQAAISLENARLYQAAQQALKELKEAQLQLVQSEKMSALGNLIAGIAHEINNPVNFLNGNINPALDYINDLFELVDLFQKEYLNCSAVIQEKIKVIELDYIREDLPQLINSMREGVKRIKDISTSLRTFSRADTYRPVSFNIHDGINSTLMILTHRLKANEHRPQITVIKNYSDLPLIKCYAGQLNQVFMNILGNAIDALDESNNPVPYAERSDTILIQTELSPDQKQVIIRIKDNGVGMSDEVKAKIFEDLFTTKEVGKGTGLGLAIARQIIVVKHQGTIEVNSVLGKGTEFVISIPC